MQIQTEENKQTGNKAQEIQFERMKLASFNNFDGESVGESLRRSKHLWKAFVFGRWEYFDLIELRDLSTGYLNADTLYILTDKRKLADLLIIINGWSADEVNYYTEDKSHRLGGGFYKDTVLVRVWWD